jgi:hypothetical protein
METINQIQAEDALGIIECILAKLRWLKMLITTLKFAEMVNISYVKTND